MKQIKLNTLTIKECEINEELKGLVITLSDNRVFYAQYEIEDNRLHADFNTYSAVKYIYDEDIQDKFTEEEENLLLKFSNSIILNEQKSKII